MTDKSAPPQRPDRMVRARALYLAVYESQGADWNANDCKELWADKADRYLELCGPAQSPGLREALEIISDWQNVRIADEHEHSLRDIIRSITDCADRALAAQSPVLPPSGVANDYKHVIDEALVVRYLGVAQGDPRKELHMLLSWEVDVALDPKVSEAAQALIDQGAAQALIDQGRAAPSPALDPGTVEALLIELKALEAVASDDRYSVAAVGMRVRNCWSIYHNAIRALASHSQISQLDDASNASAVPCKNCDGTKRALYFSEQNWSHEIRACHLCAAPPSNASEAEPVTSTNSAMTRAGKAAGGESDPIFHGTDTSNNRADHD